MTNFVCLVRWDTYLKNIILMEGKSKEILLTCENGE